MPPRLVVGCIVAFWLGTTGYLLYREWWPWLWADSPPPFTVELADEAAPQIAHWTLWRGDKKVGTATTRMTIQKDDTFELYSAIENLEITMPVFHIKTEIKVPKVVTIQRVTREGRLLWVDSKLQVVLAAFGQTFTIAADVQGQVRDRHLHAKCALDSPFGKSNHTLDPIPLESGSMLNPLQPIARVKVRPGQRWKITNVDPLGEALRASLRQMLGRMHANGGANLPLSVAPPKVMLAEVLSEPKDLMHKRQTVSCHVIEYRSDDFSGSTWARADDGKVLRQEVSGFGEKMVLIRED